MAVEKKTGLEKPSAKKKAAKGDSYVCEVCGLAVIVDTVCGCIDCDVLCCGKPMKVKKGAAKATKR
ncbi:MAG: hypothetical protein JSV54_00930 [Chloroflexota bacterium]|nr:MAG: hypothetical protein JSV54_00930 [Chloroflexota bacterium]